NYELLEYLTKSVYRFMAKMQNLGIVEKEIFRFLRNSFYIESKDMDKALLELKKSLRKHEHDKKEIRAYLYLDIISWLESKLRKLGPAQVSIRLKYLERQNKRLTRQKETD